MEYFEKVQALYYNLDKDVFTRQDLENIFPQLKNPNKMLQQWAIRCVQNATSIEDLKAHGIKPIDVINWIKKANAPDIELKNVEFINNGWLASDVMHHVVQILEVDEFECTVQSMFSGAILRSTKDNINEFFHNWTIDDAYNGDVLMSSSNQPFIFKQVVTMPNGERRIHSHCGKNVSNEFLPYSTENWTELNSSVRPATFQEKERFFREMKEENYVWDDKEKQLKQYNGNTSKYV